VAGATHRTGGRGYPQNGWPELPTKRVGGATHRTGGRGYPQNGWPELPTKQVAGATHKTGGGGYPQNRWPGLPTKRVVGLPTEKVAGATRIDFVQNHNYVTKIVYNLFKTQQKTTYNSFAVYK